LERQPQPEPEKALDNQESESLDVRTQYNYPYADTFKMMKMRFGYVKIGSEKPTATLGIRFAKKYPYMNLKSIITDQFVF
jgi:hypothetical protein